MLIIKTLSLVSSPHSPPLAKRPGEAGRGLFRSSFVAQDLPSVGAQALDGDVYPAGGGALFPYQLVVDGECGEVAEVLFALLP